MQPKDYIEQLLQEKNFSQAIQIRAEFQKNYPKEFEDYLKNFAELNKKPWIQLCMSCEYWENNQCIKNLKPNIVPRTTDRQEFYCSSWIKRDN